MVFYPLRLIFMVIVFSLGSLFENDVLGMFFVVPMLLITSAMFPLIDEPPKNPPKDPPSTPPTAGT